MLGTILWVIVAVLFVIWLLGWLAFHICIVYQYYFHGDRNQILLNNNYPYGECCQGNSYPTSVALERQVRVKEC